MQSQKRPEFYIDTWRIQPDLNRISGEQVTEQVPAKCMGVLICLADRAGEAISREELIRANWDDQIAGTSLIQKVVYELRRILVAENGVPLIMELDDGGYRLDATVMAATGDQEA